MKNDHFNRHDHRKGVLGQQVGYRVRFDDCTSAQTQLLYVTDGMLVREAMADPLLRNYNVVFLDEAHERSLQTDVLIGVVERARKARSAGRHNPLQVVVMSATLDIDSFQNFFGVDNIQLFQIPGRQFHVQTLYTAKPIEDDYLEATVSTILQIHRHEPTPGDVLVFLPGQEEIEDAAALLRQELLMDEQDRAANPSENGDTVQWTGDKVIDMRKEEAQRGKTKNGQVVDQVMICVLYAALPPEAQLVAFQEKPPNCTRKVILATNIAETSVTVPNIMFVVDSGYHKCRQINNNSITGSECLRQQVISQAQAQQRTGRAGRVQNGICFRLYTEEAFTKIFPKTTVPEILRVNLAQVVLQLKGMGIADPMSFDFVTRPDSTSLIRATKVLYALSALKTEGDEMILTEYGKKLAKLPLDPIFGHLLLQSERYSCIDEMIIAVSMLSADNIFYRPGGNQNAFEELAGSGASLSAKAASAHRRFTSHEGDLPTYLNVYRAWQEEAIPQFSGSQKAQRKRLKKIQKRQGHKSTSSLLTHGDWCQRNFISGRALMQAFKIRQQLLSLCSRPKQQHGLGMDVSLKCGKDRESFLKCAAAGLFLQVASRIKVVDSDKMDTGRSGLLVSSRGRYCTKIGNETVSIHPTSSMFGRNPAPACVVYTELVTTKKTYIRGVTQIREDWLHEVAPDFYPAPTK